MANFGIGLGSFMQGVSQGMSIGQRYKDASKEYDAQKARDEAMDAARGEQQAAIEAKTAALMGLGQPGTPQATETPGVTTAAVEMANPQGATLPEQAPAGTHTGAPQAAPGPAPGQAAAPARAPAQAPAQPGAPAMIPAKFTPPERPGAAARGIGAPPAAANPGEQTTIEIPIGMAPSAARASQAPVTREAAAAEAKKTVPTVLEFFQKSGVPRVAEMYAQQGDIEKASAWQKWAEDAESQRNVKTWAKAYRAVEMGDWEKAGDHIMDLYKGYADGVTPVSKETVKDKDGKVTGFNVQLKSEATGETRSQFIPTSDMATLGLTALSPPQMFEATWKQKLAGDKAAADARAKVGEFKLKLAEGVALENAKQGGRVALANLGNEHKLEQQANQGDITAKNAGKAEQAKIDAKTEAFRKAGFSEDFIKDALPDIIGVGEYKKRTSPEETKRLLMTERLKDPIFAGKSMDQRRAIIAEDMQLIQEHGGAAASSAKSPASSGIGAASSPKAPSGKGRPFLDTKTGAVVYR